MVCMVTQRSCDLNRHEIFSYDDLTFEIFGYDLSHFPRDRICEHVGRDKRTCLRILCNQTKLFRGCIGDMPKTSYFGFIHTTCSSTSARWACLTKFSHGTVSPEITTCFSYINLYYTLKGEITHHRRQKGCR